MPELTMPRFTVYPKSWMKNLEQPQVNCDKFLLYGDDESWLSQLCGIIKDDPCLANLTIEGSKSSIILYAFSGLTDERTEPKQESLLNLIEAGIRLHNQL